MDNNETVLPSDPEELEELRAEEDLKGYWADVLPTITRNIQMMKALTGIDMSTANTRRAMARKSPNIRANESSRSDDEQALSPPRKRVKVSCIDDFRFMINFLIVSGFAFEI
jgi:hypothetical protein